MQKRSERTKDNPGGCQWLEGDALKRDFCGHPTVAKSSWCLQHYVRVFDVPANAEDLAA